MTTETKSRKRQGRTKWSHLVDIDPAEWEYLGSFDSNPHEDDGGQFGIGDIVQALEDSHAAGVSLWTDTGQCDHCGAHIRYVCVLRHTPSGDVIASGETCLGHRFAFEDRAHRDVEALKRAAAEAKAREAERLAALEKRAAFVAENPEAGPVIEWAATQTDDGFLSDLTAKLAQYGYWTERQLAAVVRSKARQEAYEARKALEATLPTVDCPTGKQTIEGEVLSVRWQENAYGGRLVLTVRDDRGFKVWGSAARAFQSDYRWDGDERVDVPAVEPGDRVRFSATVEQSDRDSSFGFFKRPTQAERLAVRTPDQT